MKLLIDADINFFSLWQDKAGYYRTGKDHYVHRIIAEFYLQRPLKKGEVVHHINYNKLDNRQCNLTVFDNNRDHKLAHAIQDAKNRGQDIFTEGYCNVCNLIRPRSSFSNNKRMWNKIHNRCKYCVAKYKKANGYNKSNFTWKRRLDQQYRRYKKSGKQGICWL